MSLEVLDPGLASRVVDGGRPASRHLGVPVGGAADRTAFALGNALVGNHPDVAALEVCLRGPRLRATVPIACVVYGAPFALTCPRLSLAMGKTFTLQPGDELHIGGTRHGARAYLCVRGGLQTPLILGSRSALQALAAGDVLPCQPSVLGARFLRDLAPRFADPQHLRVLPGLQADWFQQDPFFRQDYTVTTASDRMGLRLHGEPLTMPERELVSEAVAPGAVQVTRDGQCIVLGVDGQTIGGYPKIAHVSQADLDQLGQLRPGQRVRFVAVTAEAAAERFREQAERLRRWVVRLTAASG
jgi:5-oxoprolinase (ATP-hydrolysing) subunit C